MFAERDSTNGSGFISNNQVGPSQIINQTICQSTMKTYKTKTKAISQIESNEK
jgi:hypothetical protein